MIEEICTTLPSFTKRLNIMDVDSAVACRKVPPLAVVLTDTERRILWVNDDFYQITGYTIAEIFGKKPTFLQGRNTEPVVVARMRKYLASNMAFKEQITNYRKNGEEYTCRLVVHPVFNTQGTLTNYIGFEIDANANYDDSHIPLMHLKGKYATSGLRLLDEIRLYEGLKKLMEEKYLFTNPDIKLKELAVQLDTNTRYLSQVVNNQAGGNLMYFINRYRIQEAQRKLLHEGASRLTAYGIALQCGFKNKSTFYRVFKEFTGLTPKEFTQTHGVGKELVED